MTTEFLVYIMDQRRRYTGYWVKRGAGRPTTTLARVVRREAPPARMETSKVVFQRVYSKALYT